MPKCPKCKAEIDYLNYYAYELTKATVGIPEGTDHMEYSHWDSLGDTRGDINFECPECDETLFTSEKEAKKFLLEQQKQTPVITEK